MVEKNLFYSTIFDSSTTPILLPMHFGVKSKKNSQILDSILRTYFGKGLCKLKKLSLIQCPFNKKGEKTFEIQLQSLFIHL